MTSVRRIPIVALVLAASSTICSGADSTNDAASSPHPVVARLVDEGLEVASGVTTQLTQPLLTAGMTAAEQRKALEKLVGANRFDRYMQDRVVAPQKIVVTTEQDLGNEGAIRRLDQYFVAYGSLKLIREKDLLEQFMARKPDEEPEEDEEAFEQYMDRRDDLSDVDSAAGTDEATGPGQGDPESKYVYRYRVPLLQKVVISGLLQGQSFSSREMVAESAISPLDLLDDAKDPTVWQAIPRGAKNDAQLSKPIPFRGLAGYLQVTQLKFEPEAVLVECHGILVEPVGWFDGKNLLASKLPILGQDNVRRFRRKLAAFKADVAKASETN